MEIGLLKQECSENEIFATGWRRRSRVGENGRDRWDLANNSNVPRPENARYY